METKLRDLFKVKTVSVCRNSKWLTPMLILIVALGGVSQLMASSTIDNSKTILEDLGNPPKIVRSYTISDASTEDKACFPTKGKGVIFQRADGCQGSHHIWRVYDELTFNEYDNDTATIVGSVIDDNGKIGNVNIALYNKRNQGNTWNAACYLEGITDPRTLYQTFNGTISVDGKSFSVEPKVSEQHYIVADGAGFEPGQFGFGAWTGGTFGGCTEWFGNLDPIETNCDLTVDAGEDLSTCELEEVVLTANAENTAICNKVIASYKITDSNTEAGCFTADPGVIFQKYDDCHGIEYTWRAGDNLILNEYDNDTATITGSVFDQNGRVAYVDINLADKEHSGTTWNASCYLDGISGPETYYRSFFGTITADGVPSTVGTRFNAHYILANGAGFDDNQYGLGAWTGGDFGDCTEWFGNLEKITIDNSDNDLTYLWSTGETTPSITVTESGVYTVTVEDCKGCTATDTVLVNIGNANADAGDDETICFGDTTTLTVTGQGTYLWSTGETAQSIEVSPEATTTYSVTVINGHCKAVDEVIVTVEDKVIIGDYVWLDNNRNGLQDDGATGINDIGVKLYQCATGSKPETLISSTETSDGANGAGYYQFEVCPDSGEYYIVFGDIPKGLEFTMANAGDILIDSNANASGQTECFIIDDEDDLSIDAGLNEVCDLYVDAGEETEICINSNTTVDLTATIEDGSDECPGGCVYPILEQDRCFGPTGNFEIWLNSKGGISSWKFKATEQRFERLANGDARYKATASNGIDTIEMDVTFSGYTTEAIMGSPKLNDCQEYDTSDWEYWTTWTGTIVSENHGVYTMSMMGAPFQMGVGADVTRSGFGASGWFSTTGGDGYYTIGDVNIPLAECQENGVEYKWTTEDGNIVSDPYKKTISVDKPGTYIFEAMNCIDCFTTDMVVVSPINCGKSTIDKTSKISTVYPIPVASGGTLTIEFGKENSAITSKKSFGPKLKEDVSIVVYDMQGRIISIPRSFKMLDGKAIIYLDIDSIPSGKYIVRAQGNNWAESKHILVR